MRKGWFLKQCIANLVQRDEFIFCKLSNMADTCFDPGETHVGIQSSKDIFLTTQLTQAFWEAVSFINRALKCTSITALVCMTIKALFVALWSNLVIRKFVRIVYTIASTGVPLIKLPETWWQVKLYPKVFKRKKKYCVRSLLVRLF